MNMNNFFRDSRSPLYPFRWFIVITAALVIWEAYADYTGWRIANILNSGQQWGSGHSGGRTAYGSGARHK
ncbi:hypothetical protein [Filimonas effusa]|uniref:Uncharacterized protein n=1 Tax=Filimonas effusa TaxID=2508721 RepID=A0A4Q1DC70_9BACT|nr:hypothetical protein [Filimonas effusa]RXK87081.1 hypothetical protein ESB13_09930 [Filimonas effusa]